MKDRIISYLAQGFTPQQIVGMVGCSPAYVSQVQAESTEEIAKEAEKHKKNKEEEKIESGYVRLETKVQKAMEDNLPFAEFADLTRAMGLLIQRRQKAVPSGLVFNDNRQQYVVLQVPQAAIPEFVLNEKREVIAVGEKALAPLSAPAVRELFARIQAKQLPEESLPLFPPEESTDIEDVILEKLPSDF